MAAFDRRFDGLSHREIAAQLSMSIGMVMQYSKHSERRAREANKRRT
jgi:DNA-directed RNA polymerase specialized sigma24 family protein